ncbi:IMP cyclohydrolase [Pseudothermotoga sp. U03pept]|uniref:IMP cyclohydrolase n=1 Tax=Pseudothermotoga sp. U03pept TaxID=3447012 RepID=UPI0030A4ABD5
MNIHRALISVWDKTGIVDFALQLKNRDISILATHGTSLFLKEHGIDVVEIDQFTGFPQLLDGRVKTMHPKIFAAVLARISDQNHLKQLSQLGIEPIDMVVVNLRPIPKVSDEKSLLESIDIGGVALLRAAAKNYRDVVPICDQKDYAFVIDSIDQCGDIVLQERRRLCAKAFFVCGEYDLAIYKVLSDLFAIES